MQRENLRFDVQTVFMRKFDSYLWILQVNLIVRVDL